MKTLDYESAHKLVASNKDFFWDGWNMVLFRAEPNGFMQPQGMFRNGKWGTSINIAVNKLGQWKVPNRFVKSV